MAQQSQAIRDFLEEVLVVCARHGVMLSHEDGGGAFEVLSYDPAYADQYAEWLRAANDRTSSG